MLTDVNLATLARHVVSDRPHGGVGNLQLRKILQYLEPWFEFDRLSQNRDGIRISGYLSPVEGGC